MLNGGSVPVDRFFLDALALLRFGAKYEDIDIRKRTNALLRDLLGPGDEPPHPQEVHRAILLAVFPKKIQPSLANT